MKENISSQMYFCKWRKIHPRVKSRDKSVVQSEK